MNSQLQVSTESIIAQLFSAFIIFFIGKSVKSLSIKSLMLSGGIELECQKPYF